MELTLQRGGGECPLDLGESLLLRRCELVALKVDEAVQSARGARDSMLLYIQVP